MYQTQPVVTMIETIFIQPPQQQTQTIYQTYAFTIAKRLPEPEATGATPDTSVRYRKCEAILDDKLEVFFGMAHS